MELKIVFALYNRKITRVSGRGGFPPVLPVPVRGRSAASGRFATPTEPLPDIQQGPGQRPHHGIGMERRRGEDRKSVGEGKSVAVRVDLGCRRIIKKKNNIRRKQQ